MLWLVGVAGYHEERVVADDRQSRSQMEADNLKPRDLISVHAGNSSPYGKKIFCPQRENYGNVFLFSTLKYDKRYISLVELVWIKVVANILPSICFCKKQERDCRPDEEALRSTAHRYFYEIDCLLTPQRKDTCLLQAALTALTQLFWNLEIKSREKLMQLPPVITLLPGEGIKSRPSA